MKNTVAVLCSLALMLLFCSYGKAEELLNGAGATFPAPLYQAWAYDYKKASGRAVNYQMLGSEGGIEQITRRLVDFGASDAPLQPGDLKKNNLIQFPTAIGGVVPIVNIQGIKEGDLKLDAKSLCRIYLGYIEHWNDPEIRKMNPHLNLPDSEIITIHRKDGSGTTAILTTYLSETCMEWQRKVGKGKTVQWPLGIGIKGNDGVAQYVKHIPNAIGYVEFDYARQHRLAYTQIKNKAGNFISPSFESFDEAARAGDLDPEKDFYAWLVNSPGANSWPIAGATFIILAKEKKHVNERVVRFFDWALNHGDDTAKKLIYVPLPLSLKQKIRAYWKINGIR